MLSGQMKAEKKFIPQIKKPKPEKKVREIEALQSLKITIKALQEVGKTISEISSLLNKTEKEIQSIILQGK